ncbi:L-rhamnose mutarotase [Catenulispora rubra]|uniref:L-rhamnose mutarotase n=1 Tax=Catenulispora rubra TaxID=280293 RepID=UPI0018926060|nr:L-rhamnose mutarotase [Catenulispora rubra]
MPDPRDDRSETLAWRTRLLPGMEQEYTRVHRRIPEPVADALRAAGVVRWRIWRDGITLFHAIETTDGMAEMGRRMALRGAVDPEWDELIATMVDAAEGSYGSLPLVWGMDARRQFDGGSTAGSD